MIKERLIAELCDFGVVYTLYAERRKSHVQAAPRRAIVKIAWDEAHLSGEPVTRSAVFELNLELQTMKALGRKGNQLSADRFSAKKLCAWALRELADQTL